MRVFCRYFWRIFFACGAGEPKNFLVFDFGFWALSVGGDTHGDKSRISDIRTGR